MFAFAIGAQFGSTVITTSAMEMSEHIYYVREIKTTCQHFVNAAFDSNTVGFEQQIPAKTIPLCIDYDNSKGDEGFLYFPENLGSRQDFLNHVVGSVLPRCPMSMNDYLNIQGKKSIIAGSGLLQAMIQPTIMEDFKNAFYIDANKIASQMPMPRLI